MAGSTMQRLIVTILLGPPPLGGDVGCANCYKQTCQSLQDAELNECPGGSFRKADSNDTEVIKRTEYDVICCEAAVPIVIFYASTDGTCSGGIVSNLTMAAAPVTGTCYPYTDTVGMNDDMATFLNDKSFRYDFENWTTVHLKEACDSNCGNCSVNTTATPGTCVQNPEGGNDFIIPDGLSTAHADACSNAAEDGANLAFCCTADADGVACTNCNTAYTLAENCTAAGICTATGICEATTTTTSIPASLQREEDGSISDGDSNIDTAAKLHASEATFRWTAAGVKFLNAHDTWESYGSPEVGSVVNMKVMEAHDKVSHLADWSRLSIITKDKPKGRNTAHDSIGHDEGAAKIAKQHQADDAKKAAAAERQAEKQATVLEKKQPRPADLAF